MRFSEAKDPQTKEKFAVLACENCKFAETSPQPKNLSDYYTEYYGKRHGFTNDYCAWRRCRLVEKSFRKSKVINSANSSIKKDTPFDSALQPNNKSADRPLLLDVGCGDGTFLEAMRKRGWKAVGTELNLENFSNSDFAIYGDLHAVKEQFGATSFDAITMWHTLEHFYNPREVLESAFELLAPKGVLLVAVPDAQGFQAKIFGKFWLHLDLPRHLFHFDYNSLQTLLKQTGFEIKNHWHQEFEYDLLGWSQSALNAMFRQNPNVFFKMLSGHKTNTNLFIKASNFALGLIFSSISLPLVSIGSLAQKGGTLVISASKFDKR